MSEGLVCTGLAKTYGRVAVVHGVDLSLCPGEIRAVVGENGAGKSTLMKMICGIVEPTRGTMVLDGKPLVLPSPRDASRAGIVIVHQELQIVPALNLADNVMLVRPPGIMAVRGSRAETGFVRSLFNKVGLHRDPSERASSLSAAEAQLLEVAKALALRARFIVFDEPTSALPPAEVDRLLGLVEALRREGLGILYISHHLSEIMRIADSITILRDGRLVGDLRKDDTSLDEIITRMVDRPVSLYANALKPRKPELAVHAKGLATRSVSGVEFELHAGEILGFAGLIGSGMHDAAMALVGAHLWIAGTLEIDGRDVRLSSPHDAARAGIVLVPEERKEQAIIPDMSVHDNLHVGRYGLNSRNGILNIRALAETTQRLVLDFNIRLSSASQAISTLSGGNQQKAVVARCVQSNPRLLIVSEPTRGVDIGAKDEIHQRIIDLAADGTAIIVVSSELDEVLALSHRVAVFSERRMVALIDKVEATPTRVMELATPRRKRDHVAE